MSPSSLPCGWNRGEIVSRIPWNIVLLIGGLLTYVGADAGHGRWAPSARISDLLRVGGSPMQSLLVLCCITGRTSFAAGSIAVFATTMPLVPAVVADGAPPVGAVLAEALASILVDINPLGITGGLIPGAAAADDRPPLFRNPLTYGVVSVIVGPGAGVCGLRPVVAGSSPTRAGGGCAARPGGRPRG
ncbi:MULTISPECIES: hypothetical protein [unclassified Streptomyces]|uniref:hypothetical protein n=1 Tax=unclassified Streptomyces TaxID=2593676 RepID=UPI0004CA23BC|nr:MULTISPECIES: hypothetical protein [unclassified Streptomyces]